MRIFGFILLIGLSYGIGACSKSMDTIVKTVQITQLDSLMLNSAFDVILIQGSENKIEIKGAERIVSKIEITEKDGELIVTNKFKRNWLHPKKSTIELRITVKKLSKITANETCSIISENELISDELGLIVKGKLNNAQLNLDCQTFYFWNQFPCGGEIILSGKTDVLKLWNIAIMKVNAENLSCNQGYIENSSKGSCTVKCSDFLKAVVTGEGNIYSIGTPNEIVVSEYTSTGKLVIL